MSCIPTTLMTLGVTLGYSKNGLKGETVSFQERWNRLESRPRRAAILPSKSGFPTLRRSN